MNLSTSNILRVTEQILDVCGLGNFLVVDNHETKCTEHLWSHNASADRFLPETEKRKKLPDFSHYPDASYDTIVALHALDTIASNSVSRVLNEFYRVSSRYVSILIDVSLTDKNGAQRNTEWWEQKFLSAGFRRHPRSFHTLDYNGREYPPSLALLTFEKIPEAVLETYPPLRPRKGQIPYQDMLRGSGKQSDAHIVRYFMAARYIRPGDTVLDCASGAGYGSHLLYQNSRARKVIGLDSDETVISYASANYGIPGIIEFHKADAQNLKQLADNSVDFIAGFETIEYLPEPERYLSELFRVLRPSGRVMFSAPDRWEEGAGKTPPSGHVHTYSWEKLYSEVKKHFLPDHGFIQIAGGGIRLPQGQRHWEEVPCLPDMDKDAEWVLLLAMKDPLLGREVPYVETTFPKADEPDYHVGAFDKDYLNPWLLKGTVSRGFRLDNAQALQNAQQQILDTYPPDSVDYGSALCGLVYGVLASTPEPDTVSEMLQKIEDYVAGSNPNPHAMRWKVSLLFAAALLHRSFGDTAKTEAAFLRCAEYDVVPFSPLLGIKTLDALYCAGMLALVRGDITAAEKRLRKALHEAQRLMQGPWLNAIHSAESPFEPGYVECAQLMDIASRCCYSLGELQSTASRPGLSLSIGIGWYEMVNRNQSRLIQAQNTWVQDLISHRDGLIAAYQELIGVRDTVMAEREIAVAERDTAVAERNTATVERDSVAAERDAIAIERNTAIAERDEITVNLSTVTAERNTAIAEHNAAMTELGMITTERDIRTSERDILAQQCKELQEFQERTTQEHTRARAAMQEQIMSYKNSTSWKITAPLRKTVRFIRSKK